MYRAEKIILFLIVLAFAAWLLFKRAERPIPVYTLSEDDVDNLIVGNSTTNAGADGPAYMSANWAWPMPLSFWNPPASMRPC